MRERRGEGAGVRRGGAKREARATTRAQVLVAQGHVNFAEGSVQSVKVDPSRIPKGPVSGLDHHWALTRMSNVNETCIRLFETIALTIKTHTLFFL